MSIEYFHEKKNYEMTATNIYLRGILTHVFIHQPSFKQKVFYKREAGFYIASYWRDKLAINIKMTSKKPAVARLLKVSISINFNLDVADV